MSDVHEIIVPELPELPEDRLWLGVWIGLGIMFGVAVWAANKREKRNAEIVNRLAYLETDTKLMGQDVMALRQAAPIAATHPFGHAGTSRKDDGPKVLVKVSDVVTPAPTESTSWLSDTEADSDDFGDSEEV